MVIRSKINNMSNWYKMRLKGQKEWGYINCIQYLTKPELYEYYPCSEEEVKRRAKTLTAN